MPSKNRNKPNSVDHSKVTFRKSPRFANAGEGSSSVNVDSVGRDLLEQFDKLVSFY